MTTERARTEQARAERARTRWWIWPWRRGERARSEAPAPTRIAPPPVDFAPNDPLLYYLQHAGGVVDVESLQMASPGLEGLRAAGVKLVLPLVSQGELIGTINLGPRLSEQEYSSDDRRLLADLAAQAAPAVRVAQLAQRQQAEARERERLVQELKVARLIQQTLLPRRLPDLPGWSLSAHYQPARAVGGDFYDLVELPDGRIVLVIGDVTDKGVPAALVMATTRAILRGAVRTLTSPGAILQRTNDLLHPDIPPKMFVTCLCAVLEPSSGRLVYANAGHDLPYRRGATGVDELRATGMPLGLMPGMSYEEREAVLEAGDSVLFYSDGLVEAHDAERAMYGFGRLKDEVAAHAGGEGLIPYLLGSLASFTGEAHEQEDDVTLVVLRRDAADLARQSPPNVAARTRGADAAGHAGAAARPAGAAASAVVDPGREPGSGGGAPEGVTVATFRVASTAGNEREVMDRVARLLADGALPWRPAPEQLERLGTAVAEAAMNAIEHGNGGDPELPVTVRVYASPDAVTVRVADRGEASARAEAQAPDLGAKLVGLQSPRGWGLFLMRNMVDEVNETADEGHHAVELIVRRREDVVE